MSSRSPADHLAQLIASEGPVSVATLMEVALAGAGGYYAAHPAIGAEGDFITAPEVSQMFGEMIGAWILQSWVDLGAPSSWQIVELGPGRGTLACDIARVLKLRAGARAGATFHLVETSEPLRALQKGALEGCGSDVRWHSRLAEIEPVPFVIVANEFFDALPIRQFVKVANHWCERRIALESQAGTDGPRFAFVAVPTAFDVESELPQAKEARPGEIVELSPAARALAMEIAMRLVRIPGRALIIDYGYERGAHGDTLQGVRRHEKRGPLEDIGLADLTAHVDFAALAREARKAGARIDGPVGQGRFLVSLGIRERHERLASAARPPQQAALNRALERLTGASQMGDLFRAIALSSPLLPPPPGFA